MSTAPKVIAVNPLARLERIPIWPHGSKLLIMLGLGYFFAFFDITNVAYGIPVITQQFHVSTLLVSQSISFSLYGYIVGSLIVSVISDYYGRKMALITGILLYTVGSFGTALSPNVDVLIAFRFVVGMGIGTMISQVSTYMGEISPAALRGRFTGLANVFAFVGLAAVPFVAMAIVPEFSWGWRVLLFIGGFGGIFMLFMSNALIESPRWLLIHGHHDQAIALVDRIEKQAMAKMGGKSLPPVVDMPLEEKAHGFPLLSLLKPPYLNRMIILLVYWLLWYVADYTYLGLAPTFLVDKGYNLASSIDFSAISSIGFVVGALYVLWFGDKVERKISLIISGVIGGLAMILVAFASSPAMIIIGGFLFTTTIALLSILGYIITAEHFPTRSRSSGLAMCDGIGHFGGAISAPLALLIYGIYGFTGAFLLMGIATLASLIFMGFTVRATRKSLEQVTDVTFEDVSGIQL
ncbi:MAG: MFS transporter [Acidibacillus sp.]|nr:MFS transporter [Acidibacillus sp.]